MKFSVFIKVFKRLVGKVGLLPETPDMFTISLQNRGDLDLITSAVGCNMETLINTLVEHSGGADEGHITRVQGIVQHIEATTSKQNRAEVLLAACCVVKNELEYLQRRMGSAGTRQQ